MDKNITTILSAGHYYRQSRSKTYRITQRLMNSCGLLDEEIEWANDNTPLTTTYEIDAGRCLVNRVTNMGWITDYEHSKSGRPIFSSENANPDYAVANNERSLQVLSSFVHCPRDPNTQRCTDVGTFYSFQYNTSVQNDRINGNDYVLQGASSSFSNNQGLPLFSNEFDGQHRRYRSANMLSSNEFNQYGVDWNGSNGSGRSNDYINNINKSFYTAQSMSNSPGLTQNWVDPVLGLSRRTESTQQLPGQGTQTATQTSSYDRLGRTLQSSLNVTGNLDGISSSNWSLGLSGETAK
jgi:hypothetical protein